MSNVYLNITQVAERYGVDRTTVWRWGRSDPSFPKSASLSPRCSRWRLEELEAWERAKAAPVAA